MSWKKMSGEASMLYTKINEIQTEIKQLLQILTTPTKLSQNERLILLRLPTHLIKTYFTLQNFGEATATDVSKQTGKARAIESNYLNQLVMMGFCLKWRNHRKVIFLCGKIEKGVIIPDAKKGL
jgi:hypothetical protein